MPQDTTRASFTDVFIKHPVLAIVVNLIILLAGWRTMTAPAGLGDESQCSGP